ncbi:MAG: Ycf66 family protein, partial [Cyanobacteria bacterium J06631_12]
MLANILAVLLGAGSFVFYLAAFFYPEVHRRSDFLWSGLGMFYAVVLWFCAEQMTPAILLGQLTSVILLIGLGWQTLTVRRQKTPVYQQTPVVLTPEAVGDWAKSKLNQLRIAPNETVRPRLQNRALSPAITERLRQNLDPRRRPIYEYEFVEDGILQTVTELPLVAFGPSECEPPNTEFLSTKEATTEDSLTNAFTAPPSVEAEVLQEIPAPLTAENPSADQMPSEVEPAETIQKISQVDAPAGSESSSPETEAFSMQVEALTGKDSEQPAPQTTQTEQIEHSDERDNLLKPDENTERSAVSEPGSESVPSPAPLTVRQKPSLLATPLIFLGWIKDVAVSFTKPKPSRPVIDIPPRVVAPAAKSIAKERSEVEERSEKDRSVIVEDG